MVRIRRVQAEEVALARELHNRFTAQDKSMKMVRSWYEAVPELFLFVVDGDEVLGVTTGRPRGDREASLAGIGLEPDRRGEGLGTRLLDRFEDNASECGLDRLSVASAGGRVDSFYIDNGYSPTKILVMDPDGGPENYADTDFDIEWDTNEDGSRKCYVDVREYDPAFLETVRDEFGDDHAIYIMVKEI